MYAPRQRLHGLALYEILHTIWQMNTPNEIGKKRWATAPRIAAVVGEPVNYMLQLLNYYWRNNWVSRKYIKTATHKKAKADGSSYHWKITPEGKRKYKKLQNRFGDISQIINRHPVVVYVPAGRSAGPTRQDRKL